MRHQNGLLPSVLLCFLPRLHNCGRVEGVLQGDPVLKGAPDIAIITAAPPGPPAAAARRAAHPRHPQHLHDPRRATHHAFPIFSSASCRIELEPVVVAGAQLLPPDLAAASALHVPGAPASALHVQAAVAPIQFLSSIDPSES